MVNRKNAGTVPEFLAKLADVLAVDFDIEATKASPETSSSGRFSGSMRPAHRPLSNIHERGRMIWASTIDQSTTLVDFDAVSISSCHLAVLRVPPCLANHWAA
jgi:hypothetical protein